MFFLFNITNIPYLFYNKEDNTFILKKDDKHISTIKSLPPDKKSLGKTLKNVPQYISMAQLTDKVMADAKLTIEDTLASEGKPESIWGKIVPGKISRFISDNTTLDQEMCLLDQNFIKDENKSVSEYIETYGDVCVSSFRKVSLG